MNRLARINVRNQRLDEGVLRGWARAGDLDRLSVRPVHCTVAVTRARGVHAGVEAQRRGECSDLRCRRCPRCRLRRGRRRGRSCGDGGLGRRRRSSRFGRRCRLVRLGRDDRIGVLACIDSLLLQRERGRDDGTALARSVKVLQRDRGGVQARVLRALGVVGREGEMNARVGEDVAGGNVGVQFLWEREAR